MSFEILCPNCGYRPYTDFRFGGEVRREGGDLWARRNEAGRQVERWYHDAGCRRWLTTARDTRTNVLDTNLTSPQEEASCVDG